MKKRLLLIFIILISISSYSQSLKELDNVTIEDGTAIDYFGSSVSLSDDGNTALVGAQGCIVDGKAEAGKAFVYVRSGNNWELQSELIASDPEIKARLGLSVSLSSDGNTAIVGAPYKKNDTIENAGKVYIFGRTGSAWSKQAEFISGEATQTSVYGWSVSLAGDGKTAVVGAKGLSSRGKVYIYTRNGNVWTKQTDIPGESFGDSFGESVSLSADGNMVMIGAYMKSQQFTQQGFVYVYSRSASQWKQTAKFSATDKNIYDRFGAFVDISGDGNTAVIAAAGKEIDNLKFRGKIYVYVRSGDIWSEQSSFIDPEGIGNEFMGKCVISDDGNIVLFGSGERKLGGTARGKVFVYARSGNAWTKLEDVYCSDPIDYNRFGANLSISGNGKVSLIATPTRRTGTNTTMGRVYFFRNDIVISGITNVTTNLEKVTCFPNPTNGSIELMAKNVTGTIEIEVLNSEGHSIYTNKYADIAGQSIELTGSSGLYFMKISKENGEQYLLKVVKE